jgi:hypothetical protein
LFGARVDETANNGLTALCCAIYHKHTSVVKKLLELGVNPNARFDYGITPLMFAVNSSEIVSLLIAAGADAKVKTRSGQTALGGVISYSSSKITDCIAKRIRQQDAGLLLDWMIALAPLQLPICELIHVRLCSLADVDMYLELADYSIDFQDADEGVGETGSGHVYSAILTETEEVKIIQGVMDSYRRVVKLRSIVVTN